MLLIYTPHITNRVNYIMQYMFEERLGIEFAITNNKELFIADNSIFKIAYSNKHIQTGLNFFAEQLLFEEDIKPLKIKNAIYENINILFCNDETSALPFDIFASTFYMLSRYEEYLDTPKDKFDNYDCRKSILYKLNILHIPVVEQWIELLKQALLKNFPFLQYKEEKAKFGLSFDIDIAYAYKNRSIIRSAGGIIKKIFTLNFSETKNQLLTLLNKKEDMFDTYNYIFSSIKNKRPIVFFDMGKYGKFDKNPSVKNKKFRALIISVSQKAIVGLHPSYTSNTKKYLVRDEKNILEEIIQKPVTASRQHYLKLKMPETYNTLISNGIKYDYTLGYSPMYGFRTGTCNSFLFFDLIKNEATQLRLYPFACMEVTLNNYLKLSIEEAKKIISELIETTCRYKGIFIPIWHNSTLCNCGEWEGWRNVFEYMLEEIDNKKAENIF